MVQRGFIFIFFNTPLGVQTMCQGYVAFCGEQLSLHPLFFFLDAF